MNITLQIIVRIGVRVKMDVVSYRGLFMRRWILVGLVMATFVFFVFPSPASFWASFWASFSVFSLCPGV